MKLNLFKPLWGHTGSFSEACQQAKAARFQGIEGPAPQDKAAQQEWAALLKASDLQYIAEIVTGGDYVPAAGRSPDQHLDDFKRGLEASLPLYPRFITTMCGSDRWPLATVIAFYENILSLVSEHGIVISIETHRSRPTFNPWQTRQILKALAGIKITCDFSHWCVVTERLIMNEEPELLQQLAEHCHHIHARVGYAQGPQVPHPGAPEYAEALAAHTRWWQTLKQAHIAKGWDSFTVTPEFGPDGYLQAAPFTQTPVGDLWEINQWMGEHLRGALDQ
ncbi:MAG: sugar phosphate isomerase/epimerase family protein [Opitutales bacterium]